jgi:hypothetical protein
MIIKILIFIISISLVALAILAAPVLYVSWWGSRFITDKTDSAQLLVLCVDVNINSGNLTMTDPRLEYGIVDASAYKKVYVFNRFLGTYLRTDVSAQKNRKVKMPSAAPIEINGCEHKILSYELIFTKRDRLP